MITILYFAGLREQLDTGREQLERPLDVLTMGDLRAWLCQRGMPWSQVLEKHALVMMSVNQAMVDAEHPVVDGDEVAFFPPVTGG